MGWSATKRVSVDCISYTDTDNYETPKGSWFVKGWEDSWRWARYYYNDTSSPLKLSSVTVSVAPGHSNGKSFMASGAIHSPVYGGGFSITADIYVGDGDGHEYGRSLNNGSASVASISSYNCYYGYSGGTSTSDNNTSFGNPNIFSGNLGRHPVTIDIDVQACPAVQPGQYMFVHVRPYEWYESTGLICLTAADGEFTPEVVPDNQNYLWVYLNGEWQKKRKAKMWTGTKWIDMEVH